MANRNLCLLTSIMSVCPQLLLHCAVTRGARSFCCDRSTRHLQPELFTVTLEVVIWRPYLVKFTVSAWSCPEARVRACESSLPGTKRILITTFGLVLSRNGFGSFNEDSESVTFILTCYITLGVSRCNSADLSVSSYWSTSNLLPVRRNLPSLT